MRKKLRRFLPYLIMIPAVILITLVGLAFGPLSVAFGVAVVVGVGPTATFLIVYRRNRKSSEIVKCRNCGRTMIYNVFQKAGGCPRCHAVAYDRTGTWPGDKE